MDDTKKTGTSDLYLPIGWGLAASIGIVAAWNLIPTTGAGPSGPGSSSAGPPSSSIQAPGKISSPPPSVAGAPGGEGNPFLESDNPEVSEIKNKLVKDSEGNTYLEEYDLIPV